MRPVALVIPLMVRGGAERQMAYMANWWSRQGRNITLITFNKQAAYHLHPAIRRICLDEIAVSAGIEMVGEKARIKCLRLALQAAQCSNVISFISRMNMRTIAAAQGLDMNIIVSERAFPPCVPLGEADEKRRRALYPQAKAVVVQTAYAKNVWATRFLPPDHVKVIPNALADFQPLACPELSLPRQPYVLAAGRLQRQKGFDLLLDAFAMLCGGFPELRLIIAGEGPERLALERQVAALGLQARVELTGMVEHINLLMQKACCFVLPSRFEGMPNVLMEAMALQTACIASDCRTGPAELIQHHYNGLLVPVGNIAGLADAMRQVIANDALRQELARNSAGSMQRFSLPAIMPLWERLLV